MLLAPTGKAAKILEEKSLSYALTIHSCIYENQTIRSNQNEDDETVESKAIFSLKIIDFLQMLSTSLMNLL